VNEVLIQTNPLFEEIEDLQKNERLTVIAADFIGGTITLQVRAKTGPDHFNSVVEAGKFIDVSERLKLRHIDFVTGNIVVEFGTYYAGVTIAELKVAITRKIMAIKMYRERTNVGLADAKTQIETALRIWKLQGSPTLT